MQDSVLARLLAWVLLILGSAVCAWMGYLNVRDRWDDTEWSDSGLPYSLDPRITARAWIGGACGTIALLSALFLLGDLHL